MVQNLNLINAKKAKKDEFYTQLVDIENEINAYLDYNPDVFKDKTILLPCDDPSWSNFTRYFITHFKTLGLKKLISTSHSQQEDSPRGKIFTLEQGEEINLDNIPFDYLEGDGDFRCEEITKLCNEADMIITNPPFSLFREFIAWLIEGEVEFSIIGNMNAITYKEVFPLIKNNQVWLGKGFTSSVGFFLSPYEDIAVATDRKSGFIRVSGVIWITNIDHERRHELLDLKTMEENLTSNNRIMKNPNSYVKYDNYDAIEVPITAGIPSDYDGIMGVPISFLDKYSPEQFEILGTQRWSKSKELLDVYKGKVIPPENDKKTLINGKETYDRIFIKHKI